MSFLERTPFRWSQIILPLFYLALGIVAGYVAPIMWGARPGKEEVKEIRRAIFRLQGEYWGERFESLLKSASMLQASPDFIVTGGERGERWNFRADEAGGKSSFSESWIVFFASPLPEVPEEKRREVERTFRLLEQENDFLVFAIKRFDWSARGRLKIEYDWTLKSKEAKYQTTDFARELYW